MAFVEGDVLGGSYTQSVLPTPGLEYPYAITLDVSGNIYIPTLMRAVF